MDKLQAIRPAPPAAAAGPQDLPTQIERRSSALKVVEFGKLLGVGRSHAYAMLAQRKVPYYRLPSGELRLDPVKVAAWLRACEVADRAELREAA